MTAFVALAAFLTVLAVGVVAIPLLRRSPAGREPARWAALGATVLVVVGSAVLYVSWSNWSWKPEAPADSPQTMVARLARKLERDPQDLNGWLMLGRSYAVLQQYPLAARAFERADRLANGSNAEALIGEAEALALQNEAELDQRAGRLIERALQLDPNSGKALFFGAAAAMRRGDLPLARDRFARLLALDPPANIKPLLQQQIAAIDQRMAAGTAAANGSVSGPVGSNTRAAVAAGNPAPPEKSSGAAVRLTVTLSPNLVSAASASMPLFVFVRDPANPGPPLAVKKLESHFPQEVELTARDSMVPGRSIVTGQNVQVVARIARSGNPVGASGDPFGEAAYRVGADGAVNLVIDRVTP